MRAALVHEWGSPADVLEICETDEPLVAPDSVLIEVAAVGVNPIDWKIIAGLRRSAFPHHLPMIPGWDVAGTVIGTGPAVVAFEPGDRVAAYARKDHVQFGTYAERVAVPDRAVARVPDSVPLDVAAAVPLAALTADQALDGLDLNRGDVVLVQAAAGGVGGFAVQLAEMLGARVIGSASPPRHELLRSRGVEPVDYRELVSQVRRLAPEGVDAILDLVGGDGLMASPQLLRNGGRLVSITDATAISELARDPRFSSRYVFVRPDPTRLAELLALVAEGALVVDIAAQYPLEEAAAALAESMKGHTRGKIVIKVGAG